MSHNLFNVVPKTLVILVLDKGNEDCNRFRRYVFLRMRTKVLGRIFVPYILQHHVRYESDSSDSQLSLVFLPHA